jgi:hypothetical protein
MQIWRSRGVLGGPLQGAWRPAARVWTVLRQADLRSQASAEELQAPGRLLSDPSQYL